MGWKVKCIETGKVFDSQKKASEEMKISQASISRHLNGKRRHAGGYTFQKVY